MILSDPSREIERPQNAVTVVDPATGEIINLRDAGIDTLAMCLTDVRDVETNLKAVKRLVGAELHRRMDEGRHWTIDGARYRVSSESPDPVTNYDAERLNAILEAWVREGDSGSVRVMRHEALLRAIETVVSKKVKVGGVKAILKGADDELRRQIEDTRFTEERKRYPKVALR